MELKSFFAQDQRGNKVAGATCSLFIHGTTNLATGLQGPDGSPLANPFVSQSNGAMNFAAPNGLYDLKVVAGTLSYTVSVQCMDVQQAIDAASAANAAADVATGKANAASASADAAAGSASTASSQAGAATAQAGQAATSAAAAAESLADTQQEAADLRTYIAQQHRKFTVYVFEQAVATGNKLLRLMPQFNLESQNPDIDWVANCDSTDACTVVFRIVNNGVVMSTPVTITFAGGVGTITITPHSLFNGDTLEVVCTAGSATNLAITARYDSEVS